MEEVFDFDEYIKQLQTIEKVYHVIFDLSTGRILELTPAVKTTITEKNKIEISKEEAKEIMNSSLGLLSHRVDITKTPMTLISVEIANLNTFVIDDILHRVPDSKYSKIKSPDVKLTYDRNKRELKIKVKTDSKKTEKFTFNDGWIKFFVTEYNDPNVLLRDPIEINIFNLDKNVFKLTDIILPEDYSIYTRRIFKDYLLENK